LDDRINGLLPVLVPSIDVAAHVGGLVAGAVLALVLFGSRLEPGRDVPASRALRAVSALTVVVYVAAPLITVGYAGTHDRDGRPPLLEAIAAGARVRRDVGNALAWSVVTDPGAPLGTLDLAREAATRLVAAHPDDPSLADTLATAYHRVGRADDAVRVETEVAQRSPTSFHSAQLLRFRYEQARARGTTFGPGDVAGDTPPAILPQPDGFVISLPAATTGPLEAEVFVLGGSGAPLILVSRCFEVPAATR
jgi:hypothetical protein